MSEWKPITWGDVLDLFKDVSKDEPVFRVQLDSRRGKIEYRSKLTLKEWLKKVRAKEEEMHELELESGGGDE